MEILISGSYSKFAEGYNSAGVYLFSGLVPSESFERPIYFGSAKDFNRRCLTEHLKQLEKNTHINPPIQNYYNKYGKENLVLFMVEEQPPIKSILLEREQYYLDTERPFADEKRGFNISKMARSPCYWLGKKIPRSMVEAMMKANKGSKRTPEQIEHLRRCNTGRKQSAEAKEKMSLSKPNPFTIVSPEGKICNGHNFNSFAKEHNLVVKSLIEVLNGKKRHTHGWRANIPENHCPFSKINMREFGFSLISPLGQIFTETYLRGFCAKHNLYRKQIANLIKGKRKEYMGWTRNEDFYK